MLKDFKAMAELVKANPVKKRIVLCCAHDEHSLDAVYEAFKEGVVEPVFVGKEDEIRKICADEGFDFGDEDTTVYEVECACGEIIDFDEETLEKGSIVCPNCGETLEFSLDDEDEE